MEEDMRQYTLGFLRDYMSAKGIEIQLVDKDDPIHKDRDFYCGGRFCCGKRKYRLGNPLWINTPMLYFPNLVELRKHICKNY